MGVVLDRASHRRGLNVNTITIADYLYRHDAERTALVSTIDKTAASAQGSLTYQEAKDDVGEFRLPMGWSDGWGAPRTYAERQRASDQRQRAATESIQGTQALSGSQGPPIPTSVWQDMLAPILGWIFTAFAATLGAPFWFDVLNQIMVIRSTVKPHEKSGEEASLERQSKPSSQPAPTFVTAGPSRNHRPTAGQQRRMRCGQIVATPDDQQPAAKGGVDRSGRQKLPGGA